MTLFSGHWSDVRLIIKGLLISSILMFHGGSIAGASPILTPLVMKQVLWVHHCEGDSWNNNTYMYKGGLGWRPATWTEFRLWWMPTTMNLATVREQAIAMVRFADRYGWPDRNGQCYGY